VSAPILSIERLRHRHANGNLLDLAASLEIHAGEAAIITGPSGCGKSTLLRALAGCAPEESQSEWTAKMLPRRVALALQDPEAQLLCSTVEEEIALGVANLGLEAAQVVERVEEALQALDLLPLRERGVEALSVGQKQRVVLAALLAMHPPLLLLDEPFSQLDEQGASQLRSLIDRQKQAGRAVLVSAHHCDAEDRLWNARVDLAPSCVYRIAPKIPSLPRSESPAARTEPALEASGLTYRSDAGQLVLRGVSLKLERGSTTHLLATNGSGKTSLLRCLVRAHGIESGEIVVDGIRSPRPRDLAGRAGYLPQNVDRMLFEESVEREVGVSLRHSGHAPEVQREMLAETLTLCGLEELAAQPPLCLSHGERQMVALASVIACHPSLLLLDEPFTGLDDHLAKQLLSILDYCASVYGTAVLLVSHAPLPQDWGESHLRLEEGRLHEA
jgi:energy-coupling factor transport system ATP-binding protein